MTMLLSLPLFLAAVGAVFLFIGVQRLLSFPNSRNKWEALIWGSVGVALAAAFLWGAAWFFVRGNA